jgi:hypothetical protein
MVDDEDLHAANFKTLHSSQVHLGENINALSASRKIFEPEAQCSF